MHKLRRFCPVLHPFTAEVLLEMLCARWAQLQSFGVWWVWVRLVGVLVALLTLLGAQADIIPACVCCPCFLSTERQSTWLFIGVEGKNNCFEHQLFHVVSCKRCIYCCICQSISELVGNVPKSKRLQKKCSNFKCVPKVSRFHQSSSVIPPYQSLIATGFASRWPGCKWDINQNGTIYSYNHDGCKL